MTSSKVIVEHLSLSVEPGEGLLIVGPSGRGKSSLLRAISGLWNTGTGHLMRLRTSCRLTSCKISFN